MGTCGARCIPKRTIYKELTKKYELGAFQKKCLFNPMSQYSRL
jgi:hypothetical protein